MNRDYIANIGIEVHVQLTTKSKIFCSCYNTISREANTNICAICTGQPGVLPMLNKQVVDYAIAAGLATHCTINKRCSFARKHYFYPDLPKNYQVTQSTDPICLEGYVPIRLDDGSIKKIRIIRIHMEEDAGKNIHASNIKKSFVDFNRTGTPLLEIVSHPDLTNAAETREYLKSLHAIVQYLGICTGNMEEGAFRADTNVSVRKVGTSVLGTKCELKNINSFKFIADAIEYEIDRQIELLEAGGKVRQETRLWDNKERKSYPMRSKEEAADYRYFHDPDLPILSIDDSWIAAIRDHMPELPYDKFNRLCQEHGLSSYEASIIVEDQALARYVETALSIRPSKQVVHWVLRDVLGYTNEHKVSLDQCKVTPQKLASLVGLLEDGLINAPAAKEIFLLVTETGEEPQVLMQKHGLQQIGSADELEAIIKTVIAENPVEYQAYKAGKEKLFGFFVGQAMQKTKGKGNPKLINEILKKLLAV